jgi:hypothetical protein
MDLSVIGEKWLESAHYRVLWLALVLKHGNFGFQYQALSHLHIIF